jgi:membrane-associated protease RseP (regulator of RpoE activity)
VSVDPSRLPADHFDPRGDAYEPPFALRLPDGHAPGARPAVRRRTRVWLHFALFLATLASTTAWGMLHYAGFVPGFEVRGAALMPWILNGCWYSATVLGILGCHELGHYAACRHYRVDASPPYFLPAPILLTGTLGAFIRIREPIRSKRVLFDIGVAGPLAGFAIAVPALWWGIALSRVAPSQPDFTGFSLGEPLLFKAFAWLIWGTPPEGHTMILHPMAFAAWFGLLATALNLFPVGQLDGGHISYAVLGRWSTVLTLAAVVAAIVMSFFSSSLVVWTALLVLMILLFGPRHPRTEDEHVPLDTRRLMVAAAALVIFVICFTPVPIEIARLFP